MNNNELMKDLYKVLKESGWLDKATEYFSEHPEKFENCTYDNGKIADIHMSVSYQPKSLSDIPNMKPIVFISIGRVSIDEREYNVFNGKIAQSRTWIDNNLVIETLEDISNV